MEPLQNPGIDTTILRQVSDAGVRQNTQVAKSQNGKFDQILNPQTKGLEQTRTEFDVVRSESPAAVEKSLEKMIISLMMKPMFSEFAEFTFGKGVEADVYSSLFSDAVAEEIAAGGNFGLGKYTQNINFDDKSSK